MFGKCLKFTHCCNLYPALADKNRLAALGEAGRILQSSPPPKPKAISLDRTEVFATVLFTEFLKELAAIAQEHSILSYIPMEE